MLNWMSLYLHNTGLIHTARLNLDKTFSVWDRWRLKTSHICCHLWIHISFSDAKKSVQALRMFMHKACTGYAAERNIESATKVMSFLLLIKQYILYSDWSSWSGSLDPPLYALSWNLKDSHLFSGSFLCIKLNGKKLEIPEISGSALTMVVRTPLGPLKVDIEV